jgi:hypothetical protein
MRLHVCPNQVDADAELRISEHLKFLSSLHHTHFKPTNLELPQEEEAEDMRIWQP